jgi:hypothetical protein
MEFFSFDAENPIPSLVQNEEFYFFISSSFSLEYCKCFSELGKTTRVAVDHLLFPTRDGRDKAGPEANTDLGYPPLWRIWI